MRLPALLLVGLAILLLIHACASAPTPGETAVGQECILTQWDFDSMQTPPAELTAQMPETPLMLRMPAGFAMEHPPVRFKHASHAGLPCNTCHKTSGEKLFTQIDFVKTCPHTLCMGCHQQMSDEKRSSGPVSCEGCHAG